MIGKMPVRAEVSALDRDEVREQPLRLCRRRVGSVDGIRAVYRASISPVGQHRRQRLVGADALDTDVGGQVELQLLGAPGLFLAAGVVGDAVHRHAVSSDRMPRIHTGAVIWYSGLPTFLPTRSFGSRMPLSAFT